MAERFQKLLKALFFARRQRRLKLPHLSGFSCFSDTLIWKVPGIGYVEGRGVDIFSDETLACPKSRRLVSFDLPDEIHDGTSQDVGDFYLHVVTHTIKGLQASVRNILRHQMLGIQGRDFVLIGRHD